MTRRRIDPEHIAFARGQRREPTRAEEAMWQALRSGRLEGWKFKRQVPLGRYTADFVCFEARLIVELDGRPHESPEQQAKGLARDRWLRSQAFRVLRLPNDLVLGALPLAVGQVLEALTAPSPCLPSAGGPSPARGEGM